MTNQNIALVPLSFNGHVIRDRSEMLSLTDMWKAAGSIESKRPSNWARKEGTEFIAHASIILNVPGGHIQTTRGGSGESRGGTFAHWQIGLAYAKYLSPEFHMWCNTVVRERMEGQRSTAAIPADVLEEIRRTDGISRMLAHKVTEQGKALEEQGKALTVMSQALNTLVTIVQPNVPGVVIRHGKTAGAILRAAGFTNCPTRVALWFGNRLEAAGCRVEGRIDAGTSYSRLFDPDKAEAWLMNGGKLAVENKIAERRGQGVLALSGRAAFAQAATRLREGRGAIMLDGKLVIYDIDISSLKDGDNALVVTRDGRVIVDRPTAAASHFGYGFRSGLTSPSPEPVSPGSSQVIGVEWGCAILGKVMEIRELTTRLPLH